MAQTHSLLYRKRPVGILLKKFQSLDLFFINARKRVAFAIGNNRCAGGKVAFGFPKKNLVRLQTLTNGVVNCSFQQTGFLSIPIRICHRHVTLNDRGRWLV